MPFDLGYAPHDYVHYRPGYRGTSLQELFQDFPDNESCLKHIFVTRFGKNPKCKKCGRHSQEWRQIQERKIFQHSCGFNVSPLGNTALSHSRVDLKLWFYAFLHIANSPESISIKSLSRHLGIEQKTSYRMLERIRLHIAALDRNRTLGESGDCVMVRVRNFKRVRKAKKMRTRIRYLVMSYREEVSTFVIGKPRQEDLEKFFKTRQAPGSILVTDCQDTYNFLTKIWHDREFVQLIGDGWVTNFGEKENLHRFEAYFHRPMRNQHNLVHMHKLWLYLKEYEFRFNRRSNSKSIFTDLIGSFPIVDRDAVEQLWMQNSSILTMEQTS